MSNVNVIPNTVTADTVIPFVLPTVPGLPNYSMRTRLDGRDFNLKFLWNEREERWALSVYTPEEELLVAGIRIVANWPLLRFYQWDDRLPPGELIAVDLSNGPKAPPGLYDFGIGRRVELTYYAVSDR